MYNGPNSETLEIVENQLRASNIAYKRDDERLTEDHVRDILDNNYGKIEISWGASMLNQNSDHTVNLKYKFPRGDCVPIT